MYERCVKMAEPMAINDNENDTLTPMLVELAQAYHDAGDDKNARKCFERVKQANQQGLEPPDSIKPVAIDPAVRHQLRASAGDLSSTAPSLQESISIDKREVVVDMVASHSTVEDDEAFLHLQQLLNPDLDADGEAAPGSSGSGSVRGRQTIGPTISALHARIRRI